MVGGTTFDGLEWTIGPDTKGRGHTLAIDLTDRQGFEPRIVVPDDVPALRAIMWAIKSHLDLNENGEIHEGDDDDNS